MKSRRILLVLLCMTTLLGFGITGEAAAYRARMDKVQELKDDLRDALDAKDNPKAKGISHRITLLLQRDEKYWELKHVDQAVMLGRQSVLQSQAIERFAAEGKTVEALDALISLQKTCAACHDAHPEKQVKGQ